MSRLFAGGILGVVVAEMIGVMVGWRWALPAAGVAIALFGLQIFAHLTAASRPAPEDDAPDPALESLYRWKAQTDSMLQWADSTRGEWDRYLRPKLARDFLQATRQKDRAAVKAAGLLLFGDELWQWVDPDNVSPSRREEAAPGRATLETILVRLEQA